MRAKCFVKISHVLAQPSRDFVRVGSLSLWCGANSDIACATLSALCASPIAVIVARCERGMAGATLLSLCACQITLRAARCSKILAKRS